MLFRQNYKWICEWWLIITMGMEFKKKKLIFIFFFRWECGCNGTPGKSSLLCIWRCHSTQGHDVLLNESMSNNGFQAKKHGIPLLCKHWHSHRNRRFADLPKRNKFCHFYLHLKFYVLCFCCKIQRIAD